MKFEDKELKVNENNLEKISGGYKTIFKDIKCDIYTLNVTASPVNNGHICFDCLEGLKNSG